MYAFLSLPVSLDRPLVDDILSLGRDGRPEEGICVLRVEDQEEQVSFFHSIPLFLIWFRVRSYSPSAERVNLTSWLEMLIVAHILIDTSILNVASIVAGDGCGL